MPARRFRSASIVGVVLDGDVARAVHLRRGVGGIRVVGCAEAEIAPDVCDRGRIADADKLADALRELWRVGRFRTKHLAFGIDGRDATFRRLTLPGAVGDDVESAARYELDDLLPYDLDEAVTHVHEVGRTAEHVDVVAVAVRRANVELIAEAAAAAGLRLRDVTLSSTAVAHSVAGGGHDPEDTVVSVDGVSTTIVVRRDGLATVTRVLSGGGGERSTRMADEIEQALASVEEFRRGGPADVVREDGQIRRFRTVVKEVGAAIHFEESQQTDGVRGGVVLGGAFGADPALVDLMVEGVDAPVHVVSPPPWWEREEAWATFMTAAGIALGAFDGRSCIVHLDPPSLVERQTVRREAVAGAAIALLAAVPVWGVVEGARADADTASGTAIDTEFRADILAERMVAFEDLAILQENLDAGRDAYDDAVAGELWWPRLLDELAGVMPDDTFLTSVSLRRPSADTAVDEAVATASFGAVALDQAGVARWLQEVGAVDGIDDVWLVQSTASAYGDDELPVVAFVAEAELTPGAASPRALGLDEEDGS